jgi:hypothetical protein
VALRSARQCGGHSHVLLTVTSMTVTVAPDGRTRHDAQRVTAVDGVDGGDGDGAHMAWMAMDGRQGRQATVLTQSDHPLIDHP